MTLKWVPNAFTLMRFLGAAAVPVLVWLGSYGAALGVFLAAAVSDGLDGLAARALNAVSKLGALLDLWADKALVAGGIVGLMLAGFRLDIGLVALLSLTVRDLIVMAVRRAHPDASLGASGLAKVKTALVLVGISLLLASLVGGPLVDVQFALQVSGIVFLLIGCVMSVLTGWAYYRKAVEPR